MRLLSRKKPMDQDVEMSFLDHLEALRWHIIRSVISIAIFTIIAFLNKSFIYGTVFLGPARTDFWTYRMLCLLGNKYHISGLCVDTIHFTLINTELSGQFTQHISMSVTIGLLLAFPYTAWEMWRFFRPALTFREKKYTRGLVAATSILFMIGVLFGYYIITPITVDFLGGYVLDPSITNTIVVSDYISIVTMTTFSIAIVFELPIVVYFLSWGGILTPRKMREYRRHAIVIIFIVAAILTPSTDIISQTAVSVPFILLYEGSIVVSYFVERQKRKRLAYENSNGE